MTSGLTLYLDDGNFVQIPCDSGAEVSLLPFVEWNLPQALTEQETFVSGMLVNVYDASRQPLNTLKHGNSLFAHFQIPDAFADKELAVLHWDGSQWQELKTVFIEDENAHWAVVERSIYSDRESAIRALSSCFFF